MRCYHEGAAATVSSCILSLTWASPRIGLLDVDVLYEPAGSSQRYVRGQQNQPNGECHPQTATPVILACSPAFDLIASPVEQLEVWKEGRGVVTIICGITCARCELLIKSPTFYECRKGCLARCFYGIDGLLGPVAFHGPDESKWDPFPRLRLCSVCMSQAAPGDLHDSGCGKEDLDEVMYHQTHIEGE